MNPARWQEEFSFNMLILGDSKQPDYTDKDSMQYALHILEKTEAANREEIMKGTLAGDAALQAWLADCSTPQKAIATFAGDSIYNYALEMNSIYTQQHLAEYYKKNRRKKFEMRQRYCDTNWYCDSKFGRRPSTSGSVNPKIPGAAK